MYFLDFGKYKIKPEAYGPPDVAVQCFWRNADRIGINPSLMLGLWPLWERGGGQENNQGAVINLARGWQDCLFDTVKMSGDGLLNESVKTVAGLDLITATTIPISFSGSFTDFFVFDKTTGYRGSNPGFWRHSNTFHISNGGTGRPWIRYNGDVLKPTSGAALVDNSENIFSAQVNIEGGTVDWFLAGKKEHSGTHSKTAITVTPEYFFSHGGEFYNGTNKFGFITNEVLSEGIREYLSGNPYALIEPNFPPFIFDFSGGGGGTEYTQTLTGTFPGASGELGRSVIFTKLTTGLFPQATAELTKETNKNLNGSLPTASGIISKETFKTTQGSFPTSLGSITKRTAKITIGNMPTSSGEVQRSFSTSQSTAGNFPFMIGVVSSVLNPMVAVSLKVIKLLGSSLKKFLQG